MCLLDGTVRLSRPRPVSGANHIVPTRLADEKASLDPLRSVQFRLPARSVYLVTLSLSEAGSGRFGRQQSSTDIYHTIPYHTIPATISSTNGSSGLMLIIPLSLPSPRVPISRSTTFNDCRFNGSMFSPWGSYTNRLPTTTFSSVQFSTAKFKVLQFSPFNGRPVHF